MTATCPIHKKPYIADRDGESLHCPEAGCSKRRYLPPGHGVYGSPRLTDKEIRESVVEVVCAECKRTFRRSTQSDAKICFRCKASHNVTGQTKTRRQNGVNAKPEYYDFIPEELDDELTKRDMTPSALEKALKLFNGTAYRWLEGRGGVTPETAQKVADYFDRPVEELIAKREKRVRR